MATNLTSIGNKEFLYGFVIVLAMCCSRLGWYTLPMSKLSHTA